MLYRPNFCSQCGEKIERAEWPLLASRRFCDLCGTEHQAAEWLPRAVVLISIVLGAAGIFSFFKSGPRNENPSAKPTFATLAERQNPKPPGDFDTTQHAIQQSQPPTNSSQPTRPANPTPDSIKTPVTTKGAEPVYYCGAATKKGTPCSRKVKRPGERCWQHRGMPSMLEAPERLSR
jgi:hypothetical protein